jgi:hypothetical protein
MDQNPMDALRPLESQMAPCLAAVHTLVDAVSHSGAVARVSLSRSDPYSRRAGLKHSDRSDIRHRLRIKNRLPGCAAVCGFPHSARCRADIYDVGIRDDGVDPADSSTHAGWSDAAGFHSGKQRGIELGLCRAHSTNEDQAKQNWDGVIFHKASNRELE